MPETRPNEREAIRNLQRYLRQLSYDEDSIAYIPVDGIFDTDTREALIAYQRLKALEETGEADQRTWELLYQDYLISLEKNDAPTPIEVFPRFPDRYTIRADDQSNLIRLLQFMLNELSVFYPDIPVNTQSGTYDETTRQGIRAIQAAHGIPVTGETDKRTWNALAAAFNRWDGQ